EELVDELRSSDNRRAGVEDKSIALENAGAAAGLVELFDDDDVMSLCAQAYGRGQTSEAGADDQDAHSDIWTTVARGGRGGAETRGGEERWRMSRGRASR